MNNEERKFRELRREIQYLEDVIDSEEALLNRTKLEIDCSEDTWRMRLLEADYQKRFRKICKLTRRVKKLKTKDESKGE